MFEIANHFVDAAGKYFVRVVISETEAQFFVFDEYPTQEEVNEKAQAFVNARQVKVDNGNATETRSSTT